MPCRYCPSLLDRIKDFFKRDKRTTGEKIMDDWNEWIKDPDNRLTLQFFRWAKSEYDRKRGYTERDAS